MAAILFKNGSCYNRGNIKTLFKGSSVEVGNEFRKLFDRAKSKGFRMAGRGIGDDGVTIILSNGKITTNIFICETEKEEKLVKFYYDTKYENIHCIELDKIN